MLALLTGIIVFIVLVIVYIVINKLGLNRAKNES